MFSAGKTAVKNNDANYVEDVFSTHLYTGNGSTQNINNGIDLAGKGGLVWIKGRGPTDLGGGSLLHYLFDTQRGINSRLSSEDTGPATLNDDDLSSFNATGFSLDNTAIRANKSTMPYVSWTFREQPKFFDVVTYTGNNAAQTIPHNLGSTPGCVIIKCTNVGGTSWWVRHRSVPGNAALLNSSTGFAFNINDMPAVSSTALSFSSGTSTNNSGETYVAYLFAHDAGGFGLTGTDNVVSCGSFTTDGTGAAGNITLGYEAQWLLIKRSDGVGSWNIIDVMRGSSLTSYNYLQPNTSSIESSSTSAGQGIFPTATGFFVGTNFPAASANYIYIAIRRPMKVPTLGTSVFSPQTATGVQSPGFATDALFLTVRAGASYSPAIYTRLTGSSPYLLTSSTAAEALSGATTIGFETNNGVTYPWPAGYINHYLKRAPGFFDVVCYTGTGVARTVAHNLGVVPELMIVKIRSSTDLWVVYSASTGAGYYLGLNYSDPKNPNTQMWDNTTPTSSVFSLNNSSTNNSGSTFVAYLFATCLGVSKVGSYTGTGAAQTVACGFTSGARFVLIKRTDAVSDWYVWDSARGITSGTDPYFLMNSIAAEVTNTNYVDTDTTGFKVTSAAPAELNAVGGIYLFLAIA